MILSRFKGLLIPTSVAEIIVGIIVGKSFLNLIEINSILESISTLGVILLMFLSGLEIDFSIFKRNAAPLTPLAIKKAQAEPQISPVKVAIFAYLFSVVTAFLLALAFKLSGLFANITLATILFATVSLGIVISILKENELLSKNYGQTVLLFAVFGEVVPMLALTVYASLYAGKGSKLWLISILFLLAGFLFKQFRSFFKIFDHINKATTQLDMRLAFFVIIALVLTAEYVGAENILGAFLAGIVFKLIEPAAESQHKLDAIGYGFFIPFFFILTGVNLDIPSLLNSPKTLLLIPLFFLAYLIAKLPAYFGFRMRFKNKNALAGSILSGTTITLVLAVLTVAQDLNAISDQQSGAFLIAGILTCLVCPLCFNKLYSPEPEDLKKTDVTIIGANLVTVSTARHLDKGWYNVQMYTDSEKNFSTYNSETNLSLLPGLSIDCLLDKHIFDTDILLLSHHDYQVNYDMALAAKRHGVPRVIMRFENRDPLTTMSDELRAAGVEYYSTFAINVGMMQAMVESPSTLQILTRSDCRLYEVVVSNARFAGMEVKDLPFINEVTISRIFRKGRPISPHGNTEIELGDHILFSGKGDIVPKIRALLEKLNE
ncbi:CPA2 family monovalent cation proton (H+) antiporter-2 [Ligilactobacillus ceti DSM 22408]|uniref:CPA2 family monovalent cation proton (H+) antiporter-2 n=2 Tax=Ligilactobacillus TaxID=2767887 RepID=A0A0R2KG84_9LACO|nr:CPA2 family monovalent cation proton (H+) antiporter-2 [Ligilactobacillus ceti DSM 22408]